MIVKITDNRRFFIIGSRSIQDMKFNRMMIDPRFSREFDILL